MTRTLSLPLVGGCQCKGLRYRINAAPVMVYACHCTNCQTISGSAFAISATIPEAGFRFTEGEPAKATWVSDAGNDRFGYFCRTCGCRIAHGQTPSIGFLSLRAGTLDDRSWVAPYGHIWTKSAQRWMTFDEDVPLSDAQPSDYAPFVERFQQSVQFSE